MAHTKAAGAAKRTVNVAGKRLGFKKFGGEHVIPGNIILRQRGTKFHPGMNTMLGKDHTIYAVAEGVVAFRAMTGFKRGQKIVDVVATAAKEISVAKAKPAKVETNEEVVLVEAEAKPKATKKPTTKTTPKKTTAKKATK